MKTEKYVIEVNDLRRDFNSERGIFKKKRQIVQAVRGISFKVKQGEVFGFLGPNGAGKTTTIKMLTTLLLPTAGSCNILGLDVTKNEKDIRSKINFVFGGERNLYWRLSARDNLRYFSDLHGISRVDQERIIPELLELVGLTDRADDKVETYSKGMKQKLQIAKGLVNDPEIIFMDEPTIGLDPVSAKEFRVFIQALSKQGKTIFLTTHYMHEADELCDRIGIIKKGNLVALDTPEQLKSRNDDAIIMEMNIKPEGVCYIEALKNNPSYRILKINNCDYYITVKLQSDKASRVMSDLAEAIERDLIMEVNSKSTTLEDVYIQLVGDVIA